MNRGDNSGHWNGTRFRSVSTDMAPERERLAFWESLFDGVEMAPIMRCGVGSFRAAALTCSGDDGVQFTEMACAPATARFAPGDNDDYFRLLVPTRGSIDVTHGDDSRLAIVPGAGLYLFDYARGCQANSASGYRNYFLKIPRALVHRAMGGEPVGGRDALRILPDTPLSLLLKHQLHGLTRCGLQMDAGESAAAMRALSGLTLAYLRRFNPHPEPEESPLDEALFVAACRYIDSTLEHPGLTATAIARAVGCSRARLYRLFERRGLAIGDHIRQTRLDYSRTLLRDPSLDIGDVALRCGYADPSAFGKAFRRRFNMTPRDWRAAPA